MMINEQWKTSLYGACLLGFVWRDCGNPHDGNWMRINGAGDH